MSFRKLSIRDVPIDRKVILVRTDYNVPLNSDGTIRDDFRIKASLPTLRFALRRGCTVVVISHLGRPKGHQPELSLAPVAERLGDLLSANVTFVDDCRGDRVKSAVRKSRPGEVLLLENLRFHEGEEANSLDFAKSIVEATGARYLVQDGFGAVHRAHASTSAITNYVPSVAGLLVKKEYLHLTKAIEKPKRPLVAVIGGAKVADKIGILERFIDQADSIIVGGALANTILAAQGVDVGASRIEENQADTVNSILEAVRAKVGPNSVDKFLVLPHDLAVAKSINETVKRRVVRLGEIETDDLALDIGDETITNMIQTIKRAGTVVWNGTLGYAEIEAFAHSSARLALALASQESTISVIGGGDTADFVMKWSNNDRSLFSHVSTGGGASLELLSGKTLPGIESLLNAPK